MTKREQYQASNYLFDISANAEEKAIKRVKEAYSFAQSLGLGKLYVCFSGGKDSVAVYGICKLAFGDKLLDCCEFNYSISGIDHPELVYFIRREFPFVNRRMYSKSMWQMMLEKKYPPTRLARYCCKEFKEGRGEGRFCITGVRWSESVNRESHGDFEDYGKSKADRRILNADNDEDRRELEHCIPKRKYMCNPIVDWTDEQVWHFIVKHNLPYCKLYDEGFQRLGCIGCPMDTKRAVVLDRYPKLKEQYLRTFNRIIAIKKKQGMKGKWETGEEMFNWWIFS